MKKKAMTINGNPRCVGGTMKHGLLLSAAVAASSALALDFANSDGTGLLSNKANWGGTLPNSSTAATVAVPGTFSTAADITTGNATLKGNGLTLSLGVYSWAANGYLYCEQAGSRVVLNGGTYTATGDMRVDNGGAGNVHLVLTNGASIVSDGRFNCGWGNGGGSSLTVTGEGSSLVANSTTQAHLGNTSANHLMRIADHGNFETYANRFNIGQGAGSIGTNNTMIVETEGTVTFHNGLNIGRANSTALTGMEAGENKLIIRSGGKVESKSGINMGSKWHSPSNLVEVTDGGSLVVRGADFSVGGAGANAEVGSGSSWNRLRVVGGAYSQLSGTCIMGDMNGQGYSSDYNSFFAGTNAALDIANMYVGNYGACNEAVFDGVTNGMTMSKVYLGAEIGATNNVFRAYHVQSMSIDDLRVGWRGNSNFLEMVDVTNLTIDTLRVGMNSWSNRAEIVGRESLSISSIYMGSPGSGDNYALVDAGTSGAALDFSILHQAQGFGNEIELRNFTADCVVGGFYWGAGVTNATLRMGPGCVFNTWVTGSASPLCLAFAGPGCRLVIDGADWTHGTSGEANDGYMSVGVYNTDNHLEVINGGKLIIKASTFGFGTKDRSQITVGDESEMEVYRIREYGSNNRITISNGTFRATVECNLPRIDDDAPITTNNVVEFLGDAPRMIGDGCALNFNSRDVDGKSLMKDSYLHFTVPKYGYSNTTPPLETTGGKNIVIKSGNFITLDVSQFARRGGRTLLMRASGTINIENLAELGSKLPEHAVLTLSADNKELWLRMPYRRALCIIFR